MISTSSFYASSRIRLKMIARSSGQTNSVKYTREQRLTKNLQSPNDHRNDDSNDNSNSSSASSNPTSENSDSDFCLSETSSIDEDSSLKKEANEYEQSRQKNVDEKMAFLKTLNFNQIPENPLTSKPKKIRTKKPKKTAGEELPTRSSMREGRKQVCYKEEDIPVEPVEKIPPKATGKRKSTKRSKRKYDSTSDSD